MHNDWGLYYRLPLGGDIKLYHAILLTEHENNVALANELAFSPKHQSLRASTDDKIRKRMNAVQKTTLKKSPNTIFKQRDIDLIPLDDMDHTMVDDPSITGVIVKINDRMGKSSPHCIDVTLAAARKLNFVGKGIAKVLVEEIEIVPLADSLTNSSNK